MEQAAIKYKFDLVEYATPNFLNTQDGVKAYFDKKKTYFQTDFYIAQRKERNILLDDGGQPLGGQWSYDADNRLKFPKTAVAPVVKAASGNVFIEDAKKYTSLNYASNYGDINNFIYPVNFDGAEKWLDDFLEQRFQNFGIYEDALVEKEHFLHHSLLSPLLNIGLSWRGSTTRPCISSSDSCAITRFTSPRSCARGS